VVIADTATELAPARGGYYDRNPIWFRGAAMNRGRGTARRAACRMMPAITIANVSWR